MPRRKNFNVKYKNTSSRNLKQSQNVDNYVDKLGQRGITVEKGDAYMSFKDMIEERESINNPNILENKTFSRIKNKNQSLEKKFDSEDDPIYDIDEQPSIVEENNTRSDAVRVYYSRFIEEELQKVATTSAGNRTTMSNTNAY
jgi:transcriptional regulator with PAS, ATPase and Fis domain